MQRCFDRRAEAIRRWGPVVGNRYVERVGYLYDAARVSDLYDVRAFDCHPLGGDRQRQYGLRLTGQMRLIVTVRGDQAVTVEEVTDYH